MRGGDLLCDEPENQPEKPGDQPKEPGTNAKGTGTIHKSSTTDPGDATSSTLRTTLQPILQQRLRKSHQHYRPNELSEL